MKRKHLQTNYFKYLVEKYKDEIKELENKITPQDDNLNDEELIDEVDLIDNHQSQKATQSQSQNEPHQSQSQNEIETDEKIIEKIINLILKNKKSYNGGIRRK